MSIESRINNLDNPDTFWDDVRAVLGDAFFEDWQIKHLQIVAEQRFAQIGGDK